MERNALLTQRDFAHAIGVSERTLSDWLAKKDSPYRIRTIVLPGGRKYIPASEIDRMVNEAR